MNTNEPISDELLHTYLDGELDAKSFQAVSIAMQTDPGLRLRAEKMRATKSLVQCAFANAVPPTRERPLTVKNRWFQLYGIAASFIALAICFTAGMVGYKTAPYYMDRVQATATTMDAKRLVLHIGESDPDRFAATLDYAEKVLLSRKTEDMVIEVVTNAGGIDLLRDGVSPYKARVAALMQQHQNIHFFACMNTLRNLERQGVKANLMNNVRTEKTAVDHIVNRVLEGWTYIKMDHVPAI